MNVWLSPQPLKPLPASHAPRPGRLPLAATCAAKAPSRYTCTFAAAEVSRLTAQPTTWIPLVVALALSMLPKGWLYATRGRTASRIVGITE